MFREKIGRIRTFSFASEYTTVVRMQSILKVRSESDVYSKLDVFFVFLKFERFQEIDKN